VFLYKGVHGVFLLERLVVQTFWEKKTPFPFLFGCGEAALGGKNPGLNSAADARNIRSPVASEPSQRGTHRRRSQRRAAPERRDAHLPLVCENA
jgi:hypothetical protein